MQSKLNIALKPWEVTRSNVVPGADISHAWTQVLYIL